MPKLIFAAAAWLLRPPPRVPAFVSPGRAAGPPPAAFERTGATSRTSILVPWI
jgi:hypothetical protein